MRAAGPERKTAHFCAIVSGGGSRIRTGDILLAKQTLYQLSYTPDSSMVGQTRIELVTSSLSGTRSNQLSYKPYLGVRPRKGSGTRKESVRASTWPGPPIAAVLPCSLERR